MVRSINEVEGIPGTYTLAEILSQPECWRECLSAIDGDRQLEKIRKQVACNAAWLFIGCGSSYYVALAAAASWTWLTGLRARAAPASEILLFPDLILGDGTCCQPVLISRSGRTSEMVRAAEYLETERNIRTLAVSCAAHRALDAISAATLYLLPADERSTVMTRSFTSMLIGLQVLGATVGQKPAFIGALHQLPAQAQGALDAMQPRIESFVERREFADYVFLGQGPFFGLASEGQLKVKEMSCSYAQVFHTLEFRHGPKAIAGPETLITFFVSESAYGAECGVLEEVKELGATTLVIANKADERLQASADLLLELNLEVPEFARLGAYMFAGQLLGVYTGLRKGFNPDNPRNLSRVVLLDGGK